MFDALIDSLTVFDAIVFAVVLMSALMGFSRGFMRELATLAALFVASAATYLGYRFFGEKIASYLPENAPDFTSLAIVFSVAFLIVYILTRIVGGRFTSLIQGAEGVGMLDRMVGFVFGIARGLALPFVLAWLLIIMVPPQAVPEFISQSVTYPYFERIATSLNANIPDIAAQPDG